MKRKNLKRSFLLSVLALLLCVSTFVGTTFAWFSETITNQNNKIMAGNLDVELYYKLNAGDAWTEVTETSELFDDAALWEPGYTQVVYFKIENKGTLALKYQLGVNVISESAGTNVAGESFKLSDYIMFGVNKTDDEAFFADRAAAVAAASATAKKISEGFTKAGELVAGTATAPSDEFVSMVVYMPETTENEANYLTGTVAPEINLGIELYATQMMNEEDSFGPDYDEDADIPAMVSNASELTAALAAGGDVILTADINMDVATTGFTVANGITSKLDLNGHDIIATSTSAEGVQLFNVNGNLEIVGQGTISLTNPDFAWTTSYRYTAINVREAGVVTLGEGVNVVCTTGENTADGYGMAYAVDIYTTGTLNVNGASLHSNYIAVRCFYGASVVNVNSGSITSSRNNWGIWLQEANNAVITIANGITYTTDTYGIYIFG